MKKLTIIANLELDSCLAISLLIKNLKYIKEMECNDLLDDNLLEYNEVHSGSSYDDEGDHIPSICFCDESDLAHTIKKLLNISDIFFLIGYDKEIISKKIKGTIKDKRILCANQPCSTLAIFKKIGKTDEYSNIQLNAAYTLYQEYLKIKLKRKHLMTKKMRTKVEKILNHYDASWNIAYNLFTEDKNELKKFYYRFLEEIIFEKPSQFISDLFKFEKEMETETERIRKFNILQKSGICLVRAGSQKFFKTKILLELAKGGWPFVSIEYIGPDLEKRLLSLGFDHKLYVEKGPLIMCGAELN